MNMFDFIAERIDSFRGTIQATIRVSFIERLVRMTASPCGDTGGDGEHNRCAGSDKVAHREDTYTGVFSVGMLLELFVVVLGSNGGTGASVSDKASVMYPRSVVDSGALRNNKE